MCRSKHPMAIYVMLSAYLRRQRTARHITCLDDDNYSHLESQHGSSDHGPGGPALAMLTHPGVPHLNLKQNCICAIQRNLLVEWD
ncbi:hypothetical protein BDR04DRAFT_1110941, partial [Suillus decipiens]